MCLTKYLAVKTYGRVEVQFHSFLNLALDGSEWSASRRGYFTPRNEHPVPVG